MSKAEIIAIALCAAAAIVAGYLAIAPDPAPELPPQTAEETDADVTALREAIKEVAARDEHEAKRLKVSHVLVGYKDAPRSRVTRTREEAEQLAARLYKDVKGGADFDTIMKAHSDDPGGGTYEMTTQSRGDMVPAFGNIAWRLKVGEIGVAPLDATTSPYGWHIIKRVE